MINQNYFYPFRSQLNVKQTQLLYYNVILLNFAIKITDTGQGKKYKIWTEQEQKLLLRICLHYVKRQQPIKWQKIQKYFPDSTIASLKSQYQNLKDSYIASDNTQVNFIKRGTDTSEYEFEKMNTLGTQQNFINKQQFHQQIVIQATQMLQNLSLFQKYVIFYYGVAFNRNFEQALQYQTLYSVAPFANAQTFYEMFTQFHQFLQNQYNSQETKEFYLIHLLRWQQYCRQFNQQCFYDIQCSSQYFNQNDIQRPFDDIEYRYLQREIDNQLYQKFQQTYGQNQGNFDNNKSVSSQSEQFQQEYQFFELQDDYEY